jgi:hypothetical protein
VTAAVADLAVVTDGLRQCGGCGWWSHWLARGRCRNCVLGWTCCVKHGRLEWASSNHRRVAVHDVTRAIPVVGR